MPVGRPTVYNEETANEIATRIAGGESLVAICRDDAMPARSTVLLWVVTPDHPFSDMYARAREAAGYSHGDEALELRHALMAGEVDPQTAKVILDALKWGAERMAPKKHSARQEVDHSNSDGSLRPTTVRLVAAKPKGE